MESGRIEPLRALPVHRALQVRGWRPPENPFHLNEKREDDLLKAGIEGVALNPNRK